MRKTTEYGNNHAFVLANDKLTEETVMEFIDDFIKDREENAIFVIYRVTDEVVLCHVKVIETETDFDTAIQMIKDDILKGDLCADDENLKKALNDPQATTAKILLEYINTEISEE